ncbi:MAG: DNA polymerase III subunit delta [Planctomycetaceae bacterium]|nr:DNA polymerase III subunit delta [Planctomycetaceae bacterium]
MSQPLCIVEELLKPSADSKTVGKIGVVFGDDAFLRRTALHWLIERTGVHAEWVHYFDGDDSDWVDVNDEVSTVSLFDQDEKKVVVVRNAAKFITANRPQLEKWVEKSKSDSILILETSTWMSTTKLAKAVSEVGLAVRASIPKLKEWGEPPDHLKIEKWLLVHAQKHHHLRLNKLQAEKILELVGTEFSFLDNELAKLALFAGKDGTVSDETLKETVGGWRLQTVWTILEEVAEGRVAEALAHVDRLLATGESINALLPQLSWGLRRFGVAVQLIEQAERVSKTLKIPEALALAGFRKNDLGNAERQLRRIGRARASKILLWLLEADRKLKGSHSQDERTRFMLEELLMRFSDQPGKVLTRT